MEYLFKQQEKKEKAFLGQGWAFPPQFNKRTASICMVSQEEDIWQSLQILFSTSIRERVLQADYGCNLEDFVFAPLNVTMITYLENLIEKNIALHEPRIRLEKLSVTPYPLEGKGEIILTYLIRNTNTRRNKVYPFYIQEGSNVEL